MPLLMTARMRSLPASGAIVRVLSPDSASESTSSFVTESARNEATDIERPSPRMSLQSASISG